MPNQLLNSFAERLQYAMDEKRISPSELANLLEVHPSQISRYLHGKTSTASRSTAVKLSRILSVSIDWLLKGEGDAIPTTIHQSYDKVRNLPAGGTPTYMEGTNSEFNTKMNINISTVKASNRLIQLINQTTEAILQEKKMPESTKKNILKRIDDDIAYLKTVIDTLL